MKENDDIVSAIKELTKIFKYERYIYNTTTVISFFALLICAIYLFMKGDIQYVIGMFGSTGIIAFTCGKIFKMWGDAINLIDKHYGKRRYE
jgi:hypothetical protein